MSDNKLTPRLRFPEFRGKGVEYHRLGTIVEFSSGGTPSKDEPKYWNGSIPWISASSMYETKLEKSEFNVTEFAIGNGTRLAKKGSILVLVRGSMLFNRVPMGIATIDVTFNQDVKALTVKDGISAEFLLYQLLAVSPRIPINETGIGAGKIDTEILEKLNMFLPILPEQQRITACLTSLDDLIAAEGRKLESLRAYKKGLMQQLFPRDGETTPRLRFPEFRGKGEWVPNKFGNYVTKSFYGTSSSTAERGKYPVLRMGNMIGGTLDFSNLVYIDMDQADFEGFRLNRGDILLNRTNSPDLVGKVSIFDREDEFITASYIVSFRLDNNRIDPWFCNQMLNTQLYQRHIKLLATPSISQANINPTSFKTGLEIMVPILAEQQRIAGFLSSLDETITSQNRKLCALRIHKKGLMQQLFPSAEAEA